MEIRDDLTEISKFQRDPALEDDEKGTNGIIFRRGALWLNESSGALFGFTDSTKGSMRWEELPQDVPAVVGALEEREGLDLQDSKSLKCKFDPAYTLFTPTVSELHFNLGGELRRISTSGEDFVPSDWKVELEECGDLVLKYTTHIQYRFDSSLVTRIKEVLSAKESTLSSLERELREGFTGITKYQRDPTPEDILFHKGALWLNKSSGVYFRFTDSMDGSMRWEEVPPLERMKPLDADLMQAVNDNFDDLVMN